MKKYAFSGGQQTLELQRQLGADLSIDVAYQYLTFFLEDDDELRSIGERYAKGEMLTGEVKQRLIDVLVPLVEGHQAARARVTSDTVRDFMAVRPLEF